jgi:beta-N-acetylhexosaminidase
VIGEIIRGRIGYDGLLMSDDLGMHALSGSFTDRARGVIAAGCDLALHCSGEMTEMVEVAEGVGAMTDKARERLDRAMATIQDVGEGAPFDELVAKRDALLAYA